MNQQNKKAASPPTFDLKDEWAPDPDSPEALLQKATQRTKPLTDYEGDVKAHTHDGKNSQKLNFFDIVGMIRNVNATPTWTPRTFIEQFAFYENGGTRRLYVYGQDANGTPSWRYTALT